MRILARPSKSVVLSYPVISRVAYALVVSAEFSADVLASVLHGDGSGDPPPRSSHHFKVTSTKPDPKSSRTHRKHGYN